MADLGQRPAHQREVMMAVGLADAANALLRVLVAKMPTQCVAGIRGVSDYATARARFPRRDGSVAPAD